MADVPPIPYDVHIRELQSRDQRIGQLETQLNERDKVILILKVRSRIEELEKKFIPPPDRNETRRMKWTKILASTTRPYVRNDELMQFRSSVSTNHAVFINTVCDLYGDFSDAAAHKVLFPIRYDRASIEQMFIDIGMTPDSSKVETVEAILKPIVLP